LRGFRRGACRSAALAAGGSQQAKSGNDKNAPQRHGKDPLCFGGPGPGLRLQTQADSQTAALAAAIMQKSATGCTVFAAFCAYFFRKFSRLTTSAEASSSVPVPAAPAALGAVSGAACGLRPVSGRAGGAAPSCG